MKDLILAQTLTNIDNDNIVILITMSFQTFSSINYDLIHALNRSDEHII